MNNTMLTLFFTYQVNRNGGVYNNNTDNKSIEMEIWRCKKGK